MGRQEVQYHHGVCEQGQKVPLWQEHAGALEGSARVLDSFLSVGRWRVGWGGAWGFRIVCG